ncbi:translation initiation factor eIF-2B subunit gamma-like, partial [Durio zibethinus]|uniref:Translation initiation factor eIF2B subunit gamma n=1 Tax=Durio zibethinus TaxID=66656 RepID=A0A6P5ZPB3_DURZI
MDFQVVVLAGDTSKNLAPLVSKELPKPLLPVANRPVLYYVLHQLEQSNLKDLIVVVEGKETAVLVGGWIFGTFVDRLHVEIAAVPEVIGTAGAIRAISHHLTAKDILVVSGDLVSDVPPGGSCVDLQSQDPAGGKDKAKKPGRYTSLDWTLGQKLRKILDSEAHYPCSRP